MSLVAGDRKEPVRCIGPVGLERLIRTSLDLSATYITYKLEVHAIVLSYPTCVVLIGSNARTHARLHLDHRTRGRQGAGSGRD